ncbi:hypothetical protein [Streptomyces sp. NPDC001404]|uniref:hypothetical protein n=1 Tax=Streptomyces sp. NPDC001404 TaxID=3364571 RepID=UPI00368A245C
MAKHARPRTNKTALRMLPFAAVPVIALGVAGSASAAEVPTDSLAHSAAGLGGGGLSDVLSYGANQATAYGAPFDGLAYSSPERFTDEAPVDDFRYGAAGQGADGESVQGESSQPNSRSKRGISNDELLKWLASQSPERLTQISKQLDDVDRAAQNQRPRY